jgi:hypothetical protein
MRARTDAAKLQYEAIRGRKWDNPEAVGGVTYVGQLNRHALNSLAWSLAEPVRNRPGPGSRSFDRALWAESPTQPEKDPVAGAIVGLAQRELRDRRMAAAAAVCRFARARFGDIAEIARILALASPWSGLGPRSPAAQTEVAAALGDANVLLHDLEAAADWYRESLRLDPDCVRAHLGLARLRMPGQNYVAILKRWHEWAKPEIYLEIGVAKGLTIQLAKPPSLVIGVDPQIDLDHPLSAETHLFATTSDLMFKNRHLKKILDGRAVTLAFIDGLHTFEQTLRDFANVEELSNSKGVIVLHDTVPLDERTQRAERETRFWTGDVWRVMDCLRDARPDLDLFIIKAAPSGLAVIRNLNPRSRVIKNRFSELVTRYSTLSYELRERDPYGGFETVPNNWNAVVKRLTQ